MNTMGKINWVTIIGLGVFCIATGCSQENNEMRDLKKRVAVLEKKVNEMTPAAAPSNPQIDQQARQAALRAKFNQRIELDRKKYSKDDLTEAETLYQVANKKHGTPEATESLKRMIEMYPHINRTGCAALYLAQSATDNKESEKAFKLCIEKFNDCYYGDGVQVGAYARFQLANYYKNSNESDKAEKLYQEIKDNYPDAIDHQGNLLVSFIK